MPEHLCVAAIYRITQLHAAHRGGINAAVDAEIRGVAKTNRASPHTIANEVIAARIGATLGLPIPAGVVAEHSGELYYLSLDVSKEGKTLPPIIASDFAANQPRYAAGCVAFDVLIANCDRNPANLSLDPAFNPPRASLFDHGHALLGTGAPIGSDRLVAAVGTLGCDGRPPVNGSRHVLLDYIASSDDLLRWADRIAHLPSFVIEDACREAADLGLFADPALARELAAWLEARAGKIHELISDNTDEFKSINQWQLYWRSPS